MNKATVNLFLDTRKVKSNNKFPVKITVYFIDAKKRYGSGFDLTKEEWEKINAPKLRDASLKEVQLRLDTLVARASDIIANLEEFTFEEFEALYFGTKEHLRNNSFLQLFEINISELKKEERLGTAASYQFTLNCLREVKSKIRVSEITMTFLKQFESKSKEKGHSTTTIGINLRNIRAIVNKAIELGFMKREKYPFTGYNIPVSRNTKKSLAWKDIQALLKYKPNDPKLDKALDFWKFSYLCNGINISDIAKLQETDISNDFVQFRRTKTIRTTKKQLPIRAALHPIAKEIINKWRTPNNPYIFSVLVPGLSVVTQRNRINKLNKTVNNRLQIVFNELKIKVDSLDRITTYAARHSFATTLKRKGVSTDEISEYLGHSNIITTKAYLDSFEDALLIERNKLLVE